MRRSIWEVSLDGVRGAVTPGSSSVWLMPAGSPGDIVVSSIEETAMDDIPVDTQDVASTRLVEVELTDASGAHVEVVLIVGNQTPIRHAFDFVTGTVLVPLPTLNKGQHSCTVFVLVIKQELTPNRMYDLAVSFNGATAAAARGKLSAGSNSGFGTGRFTLAVA